MSPNAISVCPEPLSQEIPRSVPLIVNRLKVLLMLRGPVTHDTVRARGVT
ncbi:Uncharacterised protein [Mycobacteroides abscessus subsp. abscessus]|nr:Uncharacterised protein [Mycobacteroides abscessus subsp. abscessus]